MQQPFAFPTGLGVGGIGVGGLGAGLRRAGAATRTMQTIGLEWLDYAKQSSDAVTAAMQKLAAAKTHAETLAIQGAFLHDAGERFTARSAVFGDLFATLAADLARPMGASGPSRAA